MKLKAKEIQEQFIASGLLYAPNSIYHGSSIEGMSKETKLITEIAALNDFIDFLFEHSEHCDHISQRKAWDEFRQYELDEKIKKETMEEEQSNGL